MIRNTHAANPRGTVVAYSDNSAVMEGAEIERFFPGADRGWGYHRDTTHILMKVETHNHPTAIAPHPGAGTGAGGEIRDEGATGTGAKPKAGLTGFSVSNLRPPGPARAVGRRLRQARPHRLGALDHGRGAHRRRRLQQRVRPAQPRRLLPHLRDARRGRGARLPQAHHARGRARQPLREARAEARRSTADTVFVQLGGPGFLIGMGGGAASSMASGTNTESLDFDSVQRANPELERRCQEVIDACWQMGEANPILSIHDVGAGGLSNAFPELAHSGGVGADFELREIPIEEPGHDADADLVQRVAGALRPRDPRGAHRRVRRPLRARALPLCRRRHRARRRAAGGRGHALRQRSRGHAARGAARQAAAHAPRREAAAARARRRSTPPASTSRTRPTACCASRRSPTRPSSSPSATAPWAGCARATRWWARGRCRWPTSPSPRWATRRTSARRWPSASGRRVALIDGPASGRMAVGEAITNIAAASDRGHRRRQALGQLDVRGRAPGRGRLPLRHREGRGHGAVPRAGRLHSRWARIPCR